VEPFGISYKIGACGASGGLIRALRQVGPKLKMFRTNPRDSVPDDVLLVCTMVANEKIGCPTF